MFRCYLPIYLLILAATATAADQDEMSNRQGWVKASVKDGITLFNKQQQGLDLLSVRGETIIDASPATIIGIMKENSIAHEWMPYVEEKRDLQMLGKAERLEYTKVDIPWPVADRYFFNTGKITKLENGGYSIAVKSADTEPFKVPGAVLGYLHYSRFYIVPIEGGQKSFMVAEVNCDPKGLLPNWIVQYAQQGWPAEFFDGLEAMVAKYGDKFIIPTKLLEEAVSH